SFFVVHALVQRPATHVLSLQSSGRAQNPMQTGAEASLVHCATPPAAVVFRPQSARPRGQAAPNRASACTVGTISTSMYPVTCSPSAIVPVSAIHPAPE